MSDKEKTDIIDQMIRENDNYTILDYLKLISEIEVIEKFTAVIDNSKK